MWWAGPLGAPVAAALCELLPPTSIPACVLHRERHVAAFAVARQEF
jgi:hypothetical protein